jgi:ATP-dependent DNA ligase
VLLCFDVLIVNGVNLTTWPLRERRSQLEALLLGSHPCLELVTQTDDQHIAEEWLALLPSVEGVVAKRADRAYLPGRQRDWLKVKRQRTADCAVIGVVGDSQSLRLVLGLRHRRRIAPLRTPRGCHLYVSKGKGRKRQAGWKIRTRVEARR